MSTREGSTIRQVVSSPRRPRWWVIRPLLAGMGLGLLLGLQVPWQGAAKEDGQYPVRKRAFLKGHTSEYVRCVAFALDGRLLASSSDDATVRLWETATGKEKANLKGHTFPVGCVAFSPDGQTLASGAGGGRFDKPGPGELFLWDVVGGTRKTALKGHAGT